MPLDISQEIRERRLKLRLTQPEVAKMAGKSVSQVSDLENKREQIKGRVSSPSIHTLIPIIEALGGEIKIEWKD